VTLASAVAALAVKFNAATFGLIQSVRQLLVP